MIGCTSQSTRSYRPAAGSVGAEVGSRSVMAGSCADNRCGGHLEASESCIANRLASRQVVSMEVRLGPAAELRRQGCRIVEVDGRPVGVISVGEEFFAVHDRCPHMGASMCAGTLSGTLLPAAP